MSAEGFQFFIDRAQNISWNQGPVVSSTIARSGLTRSVSRGNAVWRFEVTVPDGLRYSDCRRALTQVERFDSYTDINIDFDNIAYLFKYQGNLTGAQNITVQTVDSNIVFHESPMISTEKFKRGDLIKFNGYVYMVMEDVLGNASSVTLHRPIVKATASTTYAMTYGSAVTFKVRAIEIPTYTLFGYDQISWSGPFVFYEVIE
jgi:hypothetical protein